MFRLQPTPVILTLIPSTALLPVIIQFFIGILNIFLMTPLIIQIIHLVLANILWISIVLFIVDRMTNEIEHPELN